MSTTHATTNDSFTPADFGALVDLAVKAKSVAARTAKNVGTDAVKISFPKWNADPAVGWYAELGELTPTDGSTGGVDVTPARR